MLCCCGTSNDGDGQGGSHEPNVPTALQLQHQQFLGDVSAVVLDLGTVQIDDNELLPEGITVEHLNTFAVMYMSHCEVTFVLRFSIKQLLIIILIIVIIIIIQKVALLGTARILRKVPDHGWKTVKEQRWYGKVYGLRNVTRILAIQIPASSYIIMRRCISDTCIMRREIYYIHPQSGCRCARPCVRWFQVVCSGKNLQTNIDR